MVKDCYRTLGYKKAEEFPEHFSLADQMCELANIILDNLGKRNLNTSDMQLYQIILLYIHFKASNSFLSVTVLCDRGLVGDAKSCCRKLIEMMINMKYMMDDKDTRQNQYFHHLPFAMSKDLRSRQDTPTDLSEAVPDQIRRMQKDVVQWCVEARKHWDMNEEGKPIGDFARKWSGKDLHAMARACNLESAYMNPYVLFCRSTHSSVDDMTSYFRFDDNAFGLDFEHEDIPLVMVEAIRSYLSLSILVEGAFGMGLRGYFKQIFEKLLSLGERLCED